ncbi:NADH-quinone oxidoreductase subunit A [Amycolatopsis arida]|uniref:NADH-quinone oxidoreductase subunit n=1 Tax=Amycolatopsis arida TaxID=587909 RepID=A0A1I6ATX1_9PSEU|nr:NADH-quinone oxidoreductase subunit A [Amycolatopsis arida]TDX97517.1 NADH-quinone oxidoreductase subunit A [Amycolatopsis arida]SFQ72155.1 NADH-quinone oxidoreductase subunit A [Amycolatopsis arida]
MGEYVPALLVAATGLLLVAAAYGLGHLVAARPEPLVTPAFLSGQSPREHAVSRFHVRWYPVTLLFLAFDMEMVFMYPWAVVAADVGTTAVVEMFAFLALLMVGVLYVWREGGLRWT